MLKKILICVGAIIAVGLIAYICFVCYVVFLFTHSCGVEDGPFEAQKTELIEISADAERIQLKGDAELILENRSDSLSPILILIESGKVKWTLDTDVSKTKGYENCRIWQISDLELREGRWSIQLDFIAHWTYGSEAGKMNIKRKNGDNSFCLSW